MSISAVETQLRQHLPTLRDIDTFLRIWRAVDGDNHGTPALGAAPKACREQNLTARALAVGDDMRSALGGNLTTPVIIQVAKAMSFSPEFPPLDAVDPPPNQVLLYPPETECCETPLVAEPAQVHSNSGMAEEPFFVVHRAGQRPACFGREFKKGCAKCKTTYRYSEIVKPPSKVVGATSTRRRYFRPNMRSLKYWRSPANSTVAYEAKLLDELCVWNERAKVSTMGYTDVVNELATTTTPTPTASPIVIPTGPTAPHTAPAGATITASTIAAPSQPTFVSQDMPPLSDVHLNDAMFDRETVCILQEEEAPLPLVEEMQDRRLKRKHTRRAAHLLRLRNRRKWARDHRRHCWNPRTCMAFSADGVHKLNGPSICKRRYRHYKRVPGG